MDLQIQGILNTSLNNFHTCLCVFNLINSLTEQITENNQDEEKKKEEKEQKKRKQGR